MRYVAKLFGREIPAPVYGYGATDGAAVFDAVEALGAEPPADVLLTVYREEDDGAVEVAYVMGYGRYCVETE
jgi:hypothetical protein